MRALTFAPASTSSFIVASTPSFVRLRPRVTRVPYSTPAAAISGVTPSLLGKSTSALCFSSRSTNGASPARAARSNSVAPCARIVSPPRSCGTSRYGGRRLSCRFGFAPASSSIFAASIAVTLSSLRSTAPAPLPLAARVDVGALRRQKLHHVGLALRSRPHQRRLPAECFFGVDVGARLDEHLRRVHLAAARSRHQRRLAFRVLRVGVGAGLEQHVDD